LSWDPGRYLDFADQRLRPALDLLARIDLSHPETVVDLGCGAGNVTAYLKQRWPGAGVTGVDNSPEMLNAARAVSAAIKWESGELAGWRPARPVSIIYSNAALHWADNHAELFPRLAGFVERGGVLAVQMPRQNGAPSHQAAFQLARTARWKGRLTGLLRESPVAGPEQYYDWLVPHVAAVDIWEAEYLQIMTGANPVADWTRGTFLLPFLEALDDVERMAFESEYRALILQTYPKRRDGSTLFPFRRLFLVARP
jgi:trans-aconitate 2-methyltransferase